MQYLVRSLNPGSVCKFMTNDGAWSPDVTSSTAVFYDAAQAIQSALASNAGMFEIVTAYGITVGNVSNDTFVPPVNTTEVPPVLPAPPIWEEDDLV